MGDFFLGGGTCFFFSISTVKYTDSNGALRDNVSMRRDYDLHTLRKKKFTYVKGKIVCIPMGGILTKLYEKHLVADVTMSKPLPVLSDPVPQLCRMWIGEWSLFLHIFQYAELNSAEQISPIVAPKPLNCVINTVDWPVGFVIVSTMEVQV